MYTYMLLGSTGWNAIEVIISKWHTFRWIFGFEIMQMTSKCSFNCYHSFTIFLASKDNKNGTKRRVNYFCYLLFPNNLAIMAKIANWSILKCFNGNSPLKPILFYSPILINGGLWNNCTLSKSCYCTITLPPGQLSMPHSLF